MSRVTTSMVLEGPGEIHPEEFPVPEVRGTEGLLEIEMTSVCGSDVELYQGELHTWDPPYPLILGHEIVGHVRELGDKAAAHHGVEVGDRVVVEPYIPDYQAPYAQRGYYQLDEEVQVYGINTSCEEPPHLWGGYGEYMFLHENSKLHRIADRVPADAACLSSVMGNGVRWIVDKGEVQPEDSVVILGPGVQGLASVLMANIVGADPIVLLGTSSDKDRMQIGAKLGATHTVNVDKTAPERALGEITDTGVADVVVACAPSTQAIRTGIELVAPLGRVVIVANTEQDETPVVMDDLIQKEAHIVGGLGQSNNMEKAIRVVERHPEKVRQMITDVFPVHQAETALKKQIPGSGEFDESLLHAALQPERDR